MRSKLFCQKDKGVAKNAGVWNGRGGKKMERFEEWKKRRGKKESREEEEVEVGLIYLTRMRGIIIGEIGRLVCVCLSVCLPGRFGVLPPNRG